MQLTTTTTLSLYEAVNYYIKLY